MKSFKTLLPHYILIIAAGLLILCTLDNGQDWGGDFASYILQAKGLVEANPSQFVEANRFTIEQTTHTLAPVAYPWGYPAMLAPVYAAFGQDIVALKSVCVVCYLAMLIFIAVAFRKNHPGVWLLCLVGLFAVNPTLILFLNKINSDIPFMLVSTLCVLLIGRFAVHRRRFTSPVVDGIGLGLLIAFAFSIRTNGILLLATLLFTQIFSLCYTPNSQASDTRKQSLWLHTLPYIAFFAAMLLIEALLPSGESSHMDYLRLITPGGIKYHVTYYGFLPKDFYAGVPYPFAIYLLTLPLAIFGIARRYKRDYYIVVYLVLTYLLYVTWPVTQALRFLFPILPFYLSFVLSGLQALQDYLGSNGGRLRRALPVLPVLFVLACFSIQSAGNARDNLARDRHTLVGPYTEPAQEMFAFVRASTDPDSVLIFFKPRVLRMMTGRKAYSANNLDESNLADYVILAAEDNKWQVHPDQAARYLAHGRIAKVYSNSGFDIYRILPATAGAESHANDPATVTPH